jgi:O-antigen/teichoic acid export membrane protein
MPINRILDYVRRNEYFANVAKMAVGTVLAQVLAVLMTPVITRLYQPEAYGLCASFMALVGIISATSGLRFDMAIVIPSRDDEAWGLFRISLISAISISVAVMILALVQTTLFPLPYFTVYGKVLLLLPITALVATICTLLEYWANRKKSYALISRNKVLFSLSYPALSILLYYLFGSHASCLIVSSLLASSMVFAVMYTKMNLAGQIPSRDRDGTISLLSVAKKYRQFPKFNLSMTLFDQLTTSLPVLMFTTLFSPTIAAYFALASNVLRLPATLVGQSIGQVFFEEAARSRDDPARLRSLTIRNIKMLALVGVMSSLPVLLFGPWLFSFVFGASWEKAGVFAQIMSIMSATLLIGSPISTLPSILGKQHLHFLFSIVSFVARISAIVIGAVMKSALVTVTCYSLFEGLGSLVFVGWVVNLVTKLDTRTAVLEADTR